MNEWNDGGLPNGARKIKIYPAGASDASGQTDWSESTTKGVYILEGFGLTRSQKEQTRYDDQGTPNGGFGKDDVPVGDGVVQLADVTTKLVDTGDAFTTVRRGTGGTAESFVITNVSEPEQQGEIRKQSVRYRKLVASGAKVPPAYP